jgi:hypothetical protein
MNHLVDNGYGRDDWDSSWNMWGSVKTSELEGFKTLKALISKNDQIKVCLDSG